MTFCRATAALVRLSFLLAAWASMASTSGAIDADYIGEWSPKGGVCEFDELFSITRDGMTGQEFACTTKRSGRSMHGWILQLECSAEGGNYTLNISWRLLKNGRLRQTIKAKTLEFRRCLAIKGQQSEAAKMDTPFGRVTSEEFAGKCVECFNDAQQMGRSVGGYCPGDCVDIFSTRMVCDDKGLCKVGP